MPCAIFEVVSGKKGIFLTAIIWQKIQTPVNTSLSIAVLSMSLLGYDSSSMLLILCFNIYVVVQFYPWCKFYFPLLQTYYHILPTPKQRKIKFKPRIKLNYNIYKLYVLFCFYFKMSEQRLKENRKPLSCQSTGTVFNHSLLHWIHQSDSTWWQGMKQNWGPNWY